MYHLTLEVFNIVYINVYKERVFNGLHVSVNYSIELIEQFSVKLNISIIKIWLSMTR